MPTENRLLGGSSIPPIPGRPLEIEPLAVEVTTASAGGNEPKVGFPALFPEARRALASGRCDRRPANRLSGCPRKIATEPCSGGTIAHPPRSRLFFLSAVESVVAPASIRRIESTPSHEPFAI